MKFDNPDFAKRLEARVEKFFQEMRLDSDELAILGYSGGADSTALLAILAAIGAGPLRAVYIDHGIRRREEREAEIDLVRHNARAFSVPLTIIRIRPGMIAERSAARHEGIEASARFFRHRILASEARRRGARRIFLGHTLDDAYETVLMRFLSGSGPAGLLGIAPVRGRIVRPLSGITKREILAYLEYRGVSFSFDSTNADESLLRNRIRLRLVPLLDGQFPGWRRGVDLAVRKAMLDEEALSGLAEKLHFEILRDKSLETAIGPFQAAPAALRFRSLVAAYSLLDRFSGGPRRFSGGRVSSRMTLKAMENISHGLMYKGANSMLQQVGDSLRLSPILDFEGRHGYFIVIDEAEVPRSPIQSDTVAVSCSWEGPSYPSGLVEGSFQFPLIIRSRRPGDSLKTGTGSKAVDSLLSEWGIKKELRDSIPLVQDREGIVAILGAGYSGGHDRLRHYGPMPESRRFSIQVKGA
jgi:tRNA(Ile)-lysidine synthase